MTFLPSKPANVYVGILLDGSLIREYAMPSGFLEDGREQMFPDKK